MIHRFVVLDYNTAYRPLQKDIFIKFLAGTSVLESFLPVTMFQRYSFSFIPFRTLTSRVNDHKYLTDVIGHLSEWGSFAKTAGKVHLCNSEMRKIVLSDESGVKLTISLWEKLATQYTDEDIRSYDDNVVVVILTSCKVTIFSGIFWCFIQQTMVLTVYSYVVYLLYHFLSIRCSTIRNNSCISTICESSDERDGHFQIYWITTGMF